MDSSQPKREKWGRHLEFILATMGMCVGVGNIWRFPYICNINGGGAFLIPFIIFILACGFPLYLIEVSMGQFTGKSPIQAWDICPLFKGVSYGMLLVSFTSTTHYNMIMAWTLYYLSQSFYSTLPWTTCTNDWNTKQCTVLEKSRNLPLNCTDMNRNGTTLYSELGDGINGSYITDFQTTLAPISVNTSLNTSALDFTRSYNITCVSDQNMTSNWTTSSSEEYWRLKVLDISSGFHDLGQLKWQLVVTFVIAWIFVFLCLMKGVKSVGKVVYVTATLPYILLTVLLIRGVTLPGSVDGILYFLNPDFSKLLNFRVWIQAAIQVFYSTGPCYGILTTLASHNSFHNNVIRDSILLPSISEGTSIFGGLVIFAVLGFMSNAGGVSIQDVITSGPGLSFIVYPQAIGLIPLSQLWAVLFFLTLFSIGLDTQFCYLEVIFSCVIDTVPKVAKRKVLFKFLACLFYFLIGLPICTQGGMYIFQLIDWYCAAVCMFFFGIIESIVIGWIYGADRFGEDIFLMTGRRPPIVFKIFWKFLTPLVLTVVMVFSFIMYQPPTYGNYHYPVGARVFGWIVAIIPMVPVPCCMFTSLYYSTGTFKQRLIKSLKPRSGWKPQMTDKVEMAEELAMIPLQ